MTRLPLNRLAHLRNPATEDTAILYVSQMIGAGTGFVVSLIVARELGPTEFAVVAAYILLVDVLAGFTDFGLGTGLIKFASPLLQTAREQSYPYFRAALYAEIAAGLLVLIVGLSLSGLLERLIGEDLPRDVLVIAIIAAAITSTAAYVSAAQSAHKLFKRYAALSIGVGVTRLGAVVVLLLVDELSLYTVIYTYATITAGYSLIAFLVTPADYLRKVPKGATKRAANEILRFSGWLTLTFFLTSIMGRLDFFYLYRLEGASEAGVYAAAVQLSLAVTILIGVITTVLTPYVSERTTYDGLVEFLKRSMPIVGVIAAALVASSITFPFVIELLFGEKYSGAAMPLTILIVHLALNVVLVPVSLVYIPLGQVRIGTYISVAQLLLALALYPVLIDRLGAEGAALTVLSTTVLALIVYTLVLRRLLRRLRSVPA